MLQSATLKFLKDLKRIIINHGSMHTGNNMKQQKMILKISFNRFLTSIQKMMLT